MASSSLRVALTEDSVRQLVESSSGSRNLPRVFLPLEEDGDGLELVVGYLVYVRNGGFMLVLPSNAVVGQTLDSLSSEQGVALPAHFSGECAVETLRSRSMGDTSVQLVDLPWDFVSHLVTINRLSTAMKGKLLNFVVDGTEVRPLRDSVHELANQWIESAELATAQEYVTGEEFVDELPTGGEEARIAQSAPSFAEDAPDAVHRRLLERIAELEAAVASQKQSAAAAPLPPKAASRAPPLFQREQAEPRMSSQEWGRLQMLAGTPPPRVGTAERRRLQATNPVPDAQDHSLLELEREAAEPDPQMPPGVAELMDSPADPLHKLLAAQMQQNQLLLQKLVGPKNADPVLGILGAGGADSASGSSATGVKGCLAREAFLQSVTKLPQVASSTRANALRELGMDPSREDASLIRKYMERRMALSDHRLLTYFTMMIAEGWAIGYESGNAELLGVLSRMLFFVEQCAIDGGKCQMAWLLTGWQEPPFHLLTNAKRMPGLQPYARLCHPAWISANIAYLKDMDYLETRLQSLGSNKSKAKPDDADSAKPNPKPKPKKKGFGKGTEASKTETTPAA